MGGETAGRTRVVVVGAGFGGLAAVRALRRQRDLEVILLDRTNHHLFQPLLYQVASAALNPSEIASATRAVLRRQKNVTVLMGTMTGVDYERRVVEVDGGRLWLPYDFLVLALGGRTSYFGNESWKPHALGLKSLADAVAIRNRVLWAFEQAERESDPARIRRLMTFVVVGGGPTGVELAGAFAELRRHVIRWDFRRIDPADARVILLEAGPQLLGAFPEGLGDHARARLEKLGVEVRLKERVLEIGPGRVLTSSGEILAETVTWAAGVEGSPLAERLGSELDRAGRLVVREDLRLPGQDRVYCLGDMAHFEHPGTYGGKMLPGVAPVAMQQGRHAAQNILRQLRGQPTCPFRYVDKGSMATIGRSAAVARVGPLTFTGLPAWLAWLFVHLISLVDFEVRVLVLWRWAWAYFTWKWGVRLITQPPENAGVPGSRTGGPEEGQAETAGHEALPATQGAAPGRPDNVAQETKEEDSRAPHP